MQNLVSELLLPALVPLGLTLKVALTATLGACLTGIGAGYALSRRSLPGRELLDAICTLPLVLPPTVIGYYLLVLFGRRGVLGQWLQETFGVSLIFTWQGAALAASVVAFPLVCKAARTAFEAWTRIWSLPRAPSAPENCACSWLSPCRWPGAGCSAAPCWPWPGPWASSGPR